MISFSDSAPYFPLPDVRYNYHHLGMERCGDPAEILKKIEAAQSARHLSLSAAILAMEREDISWPIWRAYRPEVFLFSPLCTLEIADEIFALPSVAAWKNFYVSEAARQIAKTWKVIFLKENVPLLHLLNLNPHFTKDKLKEWGVYHSALFRFRDGMVQYGFPILLGPESALNNIPILALRLHVKRQGDEYPSVREEWKWVLAMHKDIDHEEAGLLLRFAPEQIARLKLP